MQCEWTEKVSALVDGELTDVEAERTRAHCAACVVCRAARRDFLRLREEFATLPDSDRSADAWQALAAIRARTKKPLRWRLAPVTAVALEILLIIIGLLIFTMEKPGILPRQTPQTQYRRDVIRRTSQESEPDFSRFDAGGRPEIRVVKTKSLGGTR